MQKGSLKQRMNRGIHPSRATRVAFPVEQIDADTCPHTVAVALADSLSQVLIDMGSSICDRLHELANNDDGEELPEWAWPGPDRAFAMAVLAFYIAAANHIEKAHRIRKESDEFKFAREWLSEMEPHSDIVRAMREFVKRTDFQPPKPRRTKRAPK